MFTPAMMPEMWRSKVDLPEPDAPIRATISPLFTLRLTLSSALFVPKERVKFFILIMDSSS